MHINFRCNGQELTNLAVQNGAVAELARVCVVCNDSKIVYEKDLYKNIGEPTEAALKVLAEKIKTEDMEFNKLTLEMDKSQRVSACDEWYTKQMKRVSLKLYQLFFSLLPSSFPGIANLCLCLPKRKEVVPNYM